MPEPVEPKKNEPIWVDEEQFTAVMRKLIASKPMPKAAIPRKRAAKKQS